MLIFGAPTIILGNFLLNLKFISKSFQKTDQSKSQKTKQTIFYFSRFGFEIFDLKIRKNVFINMAPPPHNLTILKGGKV